MWLFTETGFISAVRKSDRPDVYTVRSRDRKSLEPLTAMAKVEIVVSPLGDYPYGAFVEPVVFTEWVADQARQIEYGNFKKQVSLTRGLEFASALNNVWVAMLKTEDVSRKQLIQESTK